MRTEPGTQARQETRLQSEHGKQPYQKPAFRYERVFETMALACGKISTTQGQCAFLLKLS